MDQKQRPHSRQKTTGTGSAGVGKGREVNTGSRPVGSGGRQSGNKRQGAAPLGSGQTPKRAGFGLPFVGGNGTGANGSNQGGAPAGFAGKKLSLKTILILGLAVIVLFVAIRSCGGMGSSFGGYEEDYTSIGLSDPSLSTASTEMGIQSGNYPNIGQNAASTSLIPASSSDIDHTVSAKARPKYCDVSSAKDATIMIYMCGTDLESKYGMATKDLQEMLDATISDNINVIVTTGGCKQWKNSVFSNSKNEIYRVMDDGLDRLESNFGTAAMTDPQNLTKFIEYCHTNYEADRYMLIFWDHGGGSLSGYGYDEKHVEKSSMTLDKINAALKGVKGLSKEPGEDGSFRFDVIGFDACLMATFETALVTEQYADYLLASEETEPGTGWYYTDWLTNLSRNAAIPTVDLARTVIDTFVSRSGSGSKVTLSIMDLAELAGTVPAPFRTFASATNDMLQDNQYQQVANARAGVRQFSASNKINQVDLIDLADRIGTSESKTLAAALRGCVKYNRSTISRAYGVSIYFPYETTKTVKSAIAAYKAIGMDEEYTACIRSFASVGVGAQVAASSMQQSDGYSSSQFESLLGSYASSGTSSSPLGSLLGAFASAGSTGGTSSPAGYGLDPTAILGLLSGFSGRSMPGDYDWVDGDLIADQAENITSKFIDPARLAATEKDGKKVLELKDDEWSLIQSVELNVFAEDENGFIDLGLDNTFEWYDDDSLLLDYDGTWLTLNGQVCGYYLVSDTELDDGSWITIGRIPAILNEKTDNEQLVNLEVVFDEAHPAGTVTGAYPLYDETVSDVQAKGNIEIVEGDTITLLCDYYDIDGNYSSSYTLGETFTVPASGLKLENLTLDVDEDLLSVAYRLTDIYGNHYWVTF